MGRQLSAGAVGGDMMVLCVGIKSHKEFPLFDRSTTSGNDPNAIATRTGAERMVCGRQPRMTLDSLLWQCCRNMGARQR